MNLNIIYLSIFVNSILSLVVIFYGKKFFVIDQPDLNRKKHKLPVPLAGGFILIINILCVLFTYNFLFNNEINNNFLLERESIFSFYFGCIMIYILGLYDDKFNLKPNIKFFFLTLIILLIVLIDNNLIIESLYFKSINFHTTLDNFSIFFTILCFLLFLNAINMFDGINMQVPLYGIILSGILIYLGTYPEYLILLTICLLFILILNGKNILFLGDSGSLLLGYIISFFVIKSHNNLSNILPEEIFLLMIIPGIDMLRLFIKRLLKNKNPFMPDNDHLHHLLVSKFSNVTAMIFIQLAIITPIAFYFFVLSNIEISIMFSLIIYFIMLIDIRWLKK